MIINKNTSNTIVVTLQERQTTNNPDWLLELTNDTTKQVKVISVIDVSFWQTRYNEFLVVEPTDVLLSPPGQWSYRFLEMAQGSPPDTDPLNALTVCETGICVVIGDDTPNVNFNNNDGENKVFRP